MRTAKQPVPTMDGMSALDFIRLLGNSTPSEMRSFAGDALCRIKNGELPAAEAKRYINNIHEMLSLISTNPIFDKLEMNRNEPESAMEYRIFD